VPVKEVVTNPKCVQKVGESRDLYVRGGTELFHPFRKYSRFLCAHGRIGAKCGKGKCRNAGSVDLLVVFKGIGRVVGGADSGYMEFLEYSVHCHFIFLKSAVGAIPHACRSVFAEQIIDPEVTQQLEMSPVIERIAKRVWDRARPGKEFFKRSSIAGAEFLRHTVRSHGPPLVMIAVQANFGQIAETAIFRNLPRGKVAMKIQYWKLPSVLMVEAACRASLQQKIFRNESHMWSPIPGQFPPLKHSYRT
jgi:hypothetical protein